MRVVKRRNRFYETSRFGQPAIRVYHRKASGRKSPRYFLKCGCCDQSLELYYSEDGLEIGGVNGAVEDWREILQPLLSVGRKRARSPSAKK
jgi:hypothetical protein